MKKYVVSSPTDDCVGVEIVDYGDQIYIKEKSDLIKGSLLNEIALFKEELPKVIEVLNLCMS